LKISEGATFLDPSQSTYRWQRQTLAAPFKKIYVKQYPTVFGKGFAPLLRLAVHLVLGATLWLS